MRGDVVSSVQPLGFSWPTIDPFLFCVHHEDDYPAGNDELGPAVSLAGHDLGQDFQGIDGFRMYHGDVVPGFPQHPHRGFETVTIVRRGLIDHSDSLGAAARFGEGDVQWLTAGKGIVHAEMFPLLERQRRNPLELFQIWLNLPSSGKLVEPHFAMFWRDSVPKYQTVDCAGRAVEVELIAGALDGKVANRPPPHSWASRAESEVAIWTIRMSPGAEWSLPPVSKGVERALYVFRGPSLKIGEVGVTPRSMARLHQEAAVPLHNGPEAAELLLLQGRPIGEPVAQQGPFVMNTRAELQQAYLDYRRTQFGGWPWPSHGPVHGRSQGRFAQFPDGRREDCDR